MFTATLPGFFSATTPSPYLMTASVVYRMFSYSLSPRNSAVGGLRREFPAGHSALHDIVVIRNLDDPGSVAYAEALLARLEQNPLQARQGGAIIIGTVPILNLLQPVGRMYHDDADGEPRDAAAQPLQPPPEAAVPVPGAHMVARRVRARLVADQDLPRVVVGPVELRPRREEQPERPQPAGLGQPRAGLVESVGIDAGPAAGEVGLRREVAAAQDGGLEVAPGGRRGEHGAVAEADVDGDGAEEADVEGSDLCKEGVEHHPGVDPAETEFVLGVENLGGFVTDGLVESQDGEPRGCGHKVLPRRTTDGLSPCPQLERLVRYEKVPPDHDTNLGR